jgi:hypothetical protein
MEAIVIFLLLGVALGMLAGRLGFDSRGGPSSPEEAYSQFGLTWGDSESTPSGRPQRHMKRGPQSANRHVAASASE